MQCQEGAFSATDNVFVVDDLLATGGNIRQQIRVFSALASPHVSVSRRVIINSHSSTSYAHYENLVSYFHLRQMR